MHPLALSSLIALALVGTPRQPTPAYFTGKVVPLASVLEKQGVKQDADVAAQGMALVATDGKVYTLVKDGGSRLFFLDKKLHDRPMRLTARLLPGTQLLQVTQGHSLINGKLHEVYYWCDNCQLRYTEPGRCSCCGGRTELYEELVK